MLESEILAADELRDGRLLAPFGHDQFYVEATTYYLVRSNSYRNGTQLRIFETWLRAAIATANLTMRPG